MQMSVRLHLCTIAAAAGQSFRPCRCRRFVSEDVCAHNHCNGQISTAPFGGTAACELKPMWGPPDQCWHAKVKPDGNCWALYWSNPERVEACHAGLEDVRRIYAFVPHSHTLLLAPGTPNDKAQDVPDTKPKTLHVLGTLFSACWKLTATSTAASCVFRR